MYVIFNNQQFFIIGVLVLIIGVFLFRIKDNMLSLGNVETKLLYTLHWIILDASDECSENDYEAGIYHTNPFHYLFSIPAMTVFLFFVHNIFFIQNSFSMHSFATWRQMGSFTRLFFVILSSQSQLFTILSIRIILQTKKKMKGILGFVILEVIS